MSLPLLLVVIGIFVAVLVHSGPGLLLILLGVLLLVWPQLRV